MNISIDQIFHLSCSFVWSVWSDNYCCNIWLELFYHLLYFMYNRFFDNMWWYSCMHHCLLTHLHRTDVVKSKHSNILTAKSCTKTWHWWHCTCVPWFTELQFFLKPRQFSFSTVALVKSMTAKKINVTSDSLQKCIFVEPSQSKKKQKGTNNETRPPCNKKIIQITNWFD